MKAQIEQFLSKESKLDLEKVLIKGFPIWFFIREPLFLYTVGKEAGDSFIALNTKNQNKGFVSKIFEIFVFLKNALLEVFLIKKLHATDVLAISTNWSRRLDFESYKDIYYDDVFDSLTDKRISSKIIELPSFTRKIHNEPFYKPQRVIKGDYIYLRELISIRTSHKQLIQITSFIHEVLPNFVDKRSYTAADWNALEKKLAKIILRNVKRLPYVLKYIESLSPKVLMLTSAYSPISRIFTHFAKIKGARIIELQHSHIYPNHIGYNYNLAWMVNKSKLPIPDKLMTYGSLYTDTLIKEMGWDDQDVVTVGKPEELKNEVFKKSAVKKPFKGDYKLLVLIVSQHSITSKIIKFLEGFECFHNVLFVIKTHPRGLKEKHMYENKLSHRGKNLLVVSERKLTDIFTEANAVLGSYSTGLLDALEYGAQGYLMDIPESDFFSNLENKKMLIRVSSINDLIEKIKKNPTGNTAISINENYSPEKVSSILQHLMTD